MIRLIASDMDGTLLDSQKRMPGDLARVIRALNEKGITFVIASGRQYGSLARDFGDMAKEMAFICENGAMVVEKGKKLFVDPLPGDGLGGILRAAQGLEGVYPVICRSTCALVEESASEDFIRSMRMYYEDTRLVPRLLDCCDGLEDVCKIAFFDEGDAATHLLPALKAALSSRYSVILSGEQWVDVMKPGVNKGRAMAMMQQMKGISRAQCMAFGDYLNDYELLLSVDESYAMENALDEIKAIAKYIAPSCDEDGVLSVIRERFSL